MKAKLKICGMKYNTAQIAELQPDYLGFIFFEGSLRNFDEEIPELPVGVKKVGVFVDATPEVILEKIKKYTLDVVQLHGEESPHFCTKVIENFVSNTSLKPELWKVFNIKDTFDFSKLKSYENVVDKFLFDTKGKDKGGNGYVFDWNVLKDYRYEKPIVLSGGIGLEEIKALKDILKTEIPIDTIDVNSRFEDKPGLKNVEKLRQFMKELNNKQ